MDPALEVQLSWCDMNVQGGCSGGYFSGQDSLEVSPLSVLHPLSCGTGLGNSWDLAGLLLALPSAALGRGNKVLLSCSAAQHTAAVVLRSRRSS